ncbi:MAG TPA: phosphoglucosamine mutase [Pirellulales bacterium]|jgi:phosphomannomutase|nr:phosphoglucosamine mutase [Pirellulales bacterium]
MPELIISVSGLRGIVGAELNAGVARRYAQAFAETLPPGPVVITQDGRASGPALAAAVADALHESGRDVLDAGVAATPTTGVLVRRLEAVGGMQISASHNPAEYNGLKLFSSAGRVIPSAAGEQVAARFHAGRAVPTRDVAPGKTLRVADPIGFHRDAVCGLVDVERIRAQQFRVLLDANHGAGSVLGGPLLEALGCRVTLLGGAADGQFAHTPEPTAANLAGVLSEVTKVGAQIGFATDPDADRLAVIDERGRYLGEEYTLALCVEHVLSKTPRAGRPIVTNCSTSRMSQDLAERQHVPFFRSAVGEANVVDRMQQENALLGGEGNGGVIEPRVGWVRDSFVGMAYLLEAMALRQRPISALADALPRYEIVKIKAAVARDKIPAALAALQRHFPEAQADALDGLRLDWPDRWLLVRASNTEPVVRAIAEAPTLAAAEALCQAAVRVLEN